MSRPFSEGNLPEGGIRGEGEIHPEEVRNPEVNYDRTDMSAKAIVGFLIALAIAGVLMHLSLWAVYKYLTASERAQAPLAGPIQSSTRQLPQGDPERTFPAPRLQSDDVADMNKFSISEEEVLTTYGPSNQTAGADHIPIEQAMQIIAKQGLPTRPQPPDNAAAEAAQSPSPGSGGAETRAETGEYVGSDAAAVSASKQ
jgi:hypothetical protein